MSQNHSHLSSLRGSVTAEAIPRKVDGDCFASAARSDVVKEGAA